MNIETLKHIPTEEFVCDLIRAQLVYTWAKQREKLKRYAVTDEEKLAVEYACELLGVENPLVEICPENIA